MRVNVGEHTMAANPHAPPTADIRAQAHRLLEAVPDEANWVALLHDVQLATDRALGVIAQETDPHSELRRSIQRGLVELDHGQGIDDASIAEEFGLRP
jgi:hypothetical protein